MKPLKITLAAILLTSATLAMAQTSTPAAGNAASDTNQQSTQTPQRGQECVGPASYCSIFFGGS
ncbi:hypothetical protein [Caballeronia grimmiae]|jgi:hypothetical protein|uniref:Uncharacterized protein n=1 Tax=Caballeronia grimmiae TaxID=1071679 RepID=A0A069NXL6_9BURK|nr:hypothetical protein [Caballeronia grimmiae]KDR29761.1 hypothetical protein BG57_15535 [Caballeronia grimmiae]GGD66126.1 hypothetical protein GCM10010985_20390 [Caballeronia grimmiae]